LNSRIIEKESESWRLFGENNADGCAAFLDFGIDLDDIASQAQRAVRRFPNSGIIEQHMQFGLQLRTVVSQLQTGRIVCPKRRTF